MSIFSPGPEPGGGGDSRTYICYGLSLLNILRIVVIYHHDNF
jgi:hypothetical protein